MRIQRPEDPAPGSKYPQYRPHLPALFRFRCTYCQTPEERCGGFEGMTIDHFKPQDRYPHLIDTWLNLYYSCTVCNCKYKRNHPTGPEEANGERLVDACEEDPDDHFRLVRCPNTGWLCCIRALSDAARFSLKILKLHMRQPLRDFWLELDRLERDERKLIMSIEQDITDLTAHRDRRGSSPEIERVIESLREKLVVGLERLQSIRSRRPFPAED
jgi:hypothetical protein